MTQKIDVMIVDDSAVIRQVLTTIIERDPQLNVIAAVNDPIFALKRIAIKKPDVIILDVEMPRMDGITFLKQLMLDNPIPVIMCSTLTTSGAETTMEALASGALGFITKPKLGAKAGLEEESLMLLDTVKSAAQANLQKSQVKVKRVAGSDVVPVVKKKRSTGAPDKFKPSTKNTADVMLSAVSSKAMIETTEKIVAIGTSTGGTKALEDVLIDLPRTCPGIVVVQHMPEKFTAAFASRLNSICEVKVKEAQNNDRVLPGQVLIAPGGKHMMLTRCGAVYKVEVKDGPLVSRHKPSVDVLFRSVAKSAGKNALAIIMTGMGDDGAHGMKEIHDNGAITVAQDEATSVVYGMPKEAVKLGAIDSIRPLSDMAGIIIQYGIKAAS